MSRHEWANGWWEMETASPHVSLRHVVRGEYCGWTEHTTRPVTRREVASTVIPLIINFGLPYRMTSVAERRGVERTSFVAGVYDSWVTVEGASDSCALQINLTPLGARRLLGCGMHELTGQTVEFHDVMGASGQRLVDRLVNTPAWSDRFALVDLFLQQRLEQAAAVPAEVAWAWDQLTQSRGQRSIGALTKETGWSPKRLIAAFRDAIGVPPKSVARILRFEHLIARIDAPHAEAWTARALESGYYDQSHLVREFSQFAGCTPGAYLRERLALSGGVPTDSA